MPDASDVSAEVEIDPAPGPPVDFCISGLRIDEVQFNVMHLDLLTRTYMPSHIFASR